MLGNWVDVLGQSVWISYGGFFVPPPTMWWQTCRRYAKTKGPRFFGTSIIYLQKAFEKYTNGLMLSPKDIHKSKKLGNVWYWIKDDIQLLLNQIKDIGAVFRTNTRYYIMFVTK
jgi:hypothetical protein